MHCETTCSSSFISSSNRDSYYDEAHAPYMVQHVRLLRDTL
jgi:hypothetical protein